MSLTEAGGGLVAGSRRLLQLAGDLHDNVRVPGESLCGQVALGPDTGQPEAPASQRRSRRRRPAARPPGSHVPGSPAWRFTAHGWTRHAIDSKRD